MKTAEKTSIALPPEMVALVRGGCNRRVRVEQRGRSHALRDWTHKRKPRQQGVADLRQLWREALSDKAPGIPAEEVHNPLIYRLRPDIGYEARLATVGNHAILPRLLGEAVRIECVTYAGRDLAATFDPS